VKKTLEEITILVLVDGLQYDISMKRQDTKENLTPKKTDKAMCDELGDEKYMEEYVMEFGGVSPCDLDGEGCTEKEKKYIDKWKAKIFEEWVKQRDRLEGMKQGKMKPELMLWIKQRLSILKQLIESAEEPDQSKEPAEEKEGHEEL